MPGRPNIVLLTIGHTGSSIITRMLFELGWNAGDADKQYSESVSVRKCNQNQDWSNAADVLVALPQPWVIKDPRMAKCLPKWEKHLKKYDPLLLWLVRDKNAVEKSYLRRKEPLEAMRSNLLAADKNYEKWQGRKAIVEYEQIQSAVSLFKVK